MRARHHVAAVLCMGAMMSLQLSLASAQPVPPAEPPSSQRAPVPHPEANLAAPTLPALKAVVSDENRKLVALPAPHSPYRAWAWAGTGLSLAFLATSVTTYFLGKSKHHEMEDYVSANSCGPDCNGQPSQFYDDPARAIESDGKAFTAMSNIFFGLTLITAAATGILWGLDLKYDAHDNEQRQIAPKDGLPRKYKRVSLTPWVNGENTGISGSLTF